MTKKSIVLLVAGALLVAGGSAAIAATRDSSGADSSAVIEDAAKQLGVTPSALDNALKTALEDRIDAAVAAGRLTREQGDELKARIDVRDVPFPFGCLHRGPFAHLLQLDAAASYLGLTEAELRAQLEGGKTLAQIARDRDKSVDGLIDAMTAEVKRHLDDAVAEGRLTRAQADRVLSEVRERIADRVKGEAPSFRGHRGFRDFDGFRGGGERFHRPGGQTF